MSTIFSNYLISLLRNTKLEKCKKLTIRKYVKNTNYNLQVIGNNNCDIKYITCRPYILHLHSYITLKQKILNKNTDYSTSKRYKSDFCKDNYSPKLENLINEQINAELHAGYAYLNAATYFGRPKVALPGLHGFFMKMFYEELEHGLNFIKYQNLRGGKVKYRPLDPVECNWKDIPGTFKTALDMEKDVKRKLLETFEAASKSNDIGASDFLEDFIVGQDKSINEMARYYTRILTLANNDIGVYLFDRELYETHIKKDPAKCTAEIGSKLYS